MSFLNCTTVESMAMPTEAPRLRITLVMAAESAASRRVRPTTESWVSGIVAKGWLAARRSGGRMSWSIAMSGDISTLMKQLSANSSRRRRRCLSRAVLATGGSNEVRYSTWPNSGAAVEPSTGVLESEWAQLKRI